MSCSTKSQNAQNQALRLRVPPGTKPIHAGKFLGELIFLCDYMRDLYSHSRECRKIFLRSHFLHISQFLREIISGRTHVAPAFAPARIQENISGELFMYWFRATLKTHTPQIWGVTIHPTNLGGESSKITCFTVFVEGHFLNLGGEIFTPQIWGVWVFRAGGNPPAKACSI